MVKECINKFAIYLREDLKMFPKFPEIPCLKRENV